MFFDPAKALCPFSFRLKSGPSNTLKNSYKTQPRKVLYVTSQTPDITSEVVRRRKASLVHSLLLKNYYYY